MAVETSDGDALEYEAIVEEWFEGFCWVVIVEVLILNHRHQQLNWRHLQH